MEEIKQAAPEQPTSAEVVDIQFRPGQKIYFFDPAGAQYAAGDHVIIDTARGAEFGTVTAGNHTIPMKDVVAPLRCVLRKATYQDERIIAENRAREKKAYEVCLQKVAEHGLDMQLVSAECAFDGSKILFYFTADERVDFRELVKNLASVFHTRIELRQIGVRDKAKMVGGLGICGRPFCCATFLDDFQPVSIKMAKTQNLSLNPTKISGTCGRLMCCLKYEQDAYEYLLSRCPKEESFVDTPEGRGTVAEVNLLRQTVKVRMEDDPETVSSFSVEEIAVLRNGKAKKTDAPIPADLAPISGKGKRVRKEKKLEDTAFLDPIKFRYREDAVVEEAPKKQENPEPKEQRSRNRRPNKGPQEQKRPQEQKPKEEGQPKQKPESQPKPKPEHQPKQKQDAPKADQENKADKPNQGKRPSGKRPNYHHRRKPKPQGGGQQNQG